MQVELHSATAALKLLSQHCSDEQRWSIEVIAPFGGHDAMVQDLKEKVFPTPPNSFVKLGVDGTKEVAVLSGSIPSNVGTTNARATQVEGHPITEDLKTLPQHPSGERRWSTSKQSRRSGSIQVLAQNLKEKMSRERQLNLANLGLSGGRFFLGGV